MEHSSSPSSSSSRCLAVFVCLFSVLLLSAVPAESASCDSQTLPANKAFKLCSDLPTLSAFLHWSYDSTKSSLSMAFSAPPEKPGGWVAWGINPTAPTMLGTQALIAHRASNGSVAVQTFDISGYNVQPSNISFPVSGLSAASVNGSLVIFATWELPKGTTTVNQVWQVGSAVDKGIPNKHAMTPANMKASGKLNLLAAAAGGAPGADAPSPSTNSSSPAAPNSSSPAAPNSGSPSPSAAAPPTQASLLGLFCVAVGLSVVNLIR